MQCRRWRGDRPRSWPDRLRMSVGIGGLVPRQLARVSDGASSGWQRTWLKKYVVMLLCMRNIGEVGQEPGKTGTRG